MLRNRGLRKVIYGSVIISTTGLVVFKMYNATFSKDMPVEKLKYEEQENPRRISKEIFLQQIEKQTQIHRTDAEMYWDKLDPLVKGVLTLTELNIAARSLYYEFNRAQVDEIISIARKIARNSSLTALQMPESPRQTSIGSMLRSTGERVKQFAEGTREEMQDVAHRAVRRYLARALDIMGDQLKFVLKDPDMPVYLQNNLDLTVDNLMPDIKVEIFRKTEEFLSPIKSFRGRRVSRSFSQVEETASMSIVQQIRAFILYNMFPYDKSMWKCFKNPYWYLFNCIGVLPVVGQIWWLFLFLVKDKTDEHQLCEFIIGFKVSQFMSLGLVATLTGVFRYIRCTTAAISTCATDGPALHGWGASFFLLQILLVWAAFFRLPYTRRETKSKQRRRRLSSPINALAARNRGYKDVFGNPINMSRGGHLMKLCGYETMSLCIVFVATVAILWSEYDPWQKEAMLYWTRTLYGLLSLPFVPFKIPLVATLLMHTQKMGYNHRGETVHSISGTTKT